MVGLHFLSCSCLAWGDPALGSLGSMLGLMATSRRVSTKTFQCPLPLGPLLTHTSTGGLPTLAGSGGSVSCGSVLLSSGSWCVHNFVCAFQDWSICFPQSSGRPITRSHWPSRPDSLGIPSPFVGSPGWEAWRGLQNLHKSARTFLILLFSSLWVCDLIWSWLCPSYYLTAASLSLEVGYPFLWWTSCQWLLNS